MTEAAASEEKAPKKSKKNGESEVEVKSLFGFPAKAGAKDVTVHLTLSSLVFPEYDSRAGEKPLTAEFVTSVSEGIHQPVCVVPIDDSDKYMIIAGRRRVRAAKEAKLKEVPCRIMEIPTGLTLKQRESYMARITLAENLQRENPNDWDLAVSFKKMIDADHSQEEIAEEAGKGVPYVSQHLSMFKLDTRVQNLCRAHSQDGGMFSKARELVRVPDGDAQYEIAKDAFSKEKNWTTNDVKEVVENYKAKQEAAAERAEQKAKKARKRKPGDAEESAADDAEEVSPYASAKIEIGVKELRAMLDMCDAKVKRLREREAGPDKIAYAKGMQDGLKMAAGLKELPKSIEE